MFWKWKTNVFNKTFILCFITKDEKIFQYKQDGRIMKNTFSFPKSAAWFVFLESYLSLSFPTQLEKNKKQKQ